MRTVLPRALAALLGVFWGWFFFGLQDLTTPFADRDLFFAHLVTETGWGLLYLVLVGLPLLAYAVRPVALALAQVEVVAVALALGAVTALSPLHLLPALGVLATTEGVRRLAATPLPRPSRPTAVWSLALVTSLPWLVYAVRMARSTRLPEETWGLDHYPVQAALAFALVLLTVLAASTERQPGHALLVLEVAVAAGWLGLASASYPHLVGSLGTTGGRLAIAWAVLMLATAAWVRARTIRAAPPARPAPAGP